MKKFNKAAPVAFVPGCLIAYIFAIIFENTDAFWEIKSDVWGNYIFLPFCVIGSLWMTYVHRKSRWLPLMILMAILVAGAIRLLSEIMWRVSLG